MNKVLSIILVVLLVFLVSCNIDKPSEKNSINNGVVATTQQKKDTFTGRVPLPEISFEIPDPDNKAGHSVEKIAHSFGVAKNEKPHNISVESQSFFEKKGYKAISFENSERKVLYLTFDCGYENGYTSKILDVLKEKNVKAAFFCTLDDIKSEPELIARMINEGHIVGNHSASHPSFAEINRTKMVEEIEECENYLRRKFGYSSKFFRFPKGEYSVSSLELVGSLGLTSVFWSVAYADWETDNQKGADYAFEKVTSRLHPGAIILLHSVSSDNAEALGKIIDYAVNKDYYFSSLDKLQLSYSE